MSAIKSLQTGHVGLNVTDLDRSVDFYKKVFGFEVAAEGKEEGRRFAFLGADGKLLITLWQQSTGAHPKDRSGLHHLSFQVDSIDIVKEAEQVLRGLDAEFAYDGVVPHGEGVASGGIFFSDPDGIRLEIYAPSGAEGAIAPTEAAPTCGFF
ncbi:VOC family protein [Streptomyces sp. NBC_00503]|uniref:VOC family protein n=1 Tax=Streptomyces sp. NBC_00503 TaxID=2903659 RepID=UPI002E809005|nr:VOC family protein [Streptomyces sp. NBC_00503]WUD82563.1 VOC family protein [Streptomyces sp. NBC_00503]